MKVVGGADQWLSLAYTSELNIVFGQLILGGFRCLYVRGLTGPSFLPQTPSTSVSLLSFSTRPG